MTDKKYYGVFDAQGAPQAFYADDIYPPQEDGTRNAAIPASAVEISESNWRALFGNPETARYIDGKVVYVEPPPSPEPVPPEPTPEDQILYNHENRIRELEGQPPLDLGEFMQTLR